MQRIPAGRQSFFRFREAEVVVVERIPLAAQVGFSGFARSAQVFGNQRPAPANRGVGAVNRAQGADTCVHPDFFDHGAVHNHHSGERRSGAEHRGQTLGCDRQDRREIFRLCACHDGIHRNHLNRVIPGFMRRRGAHLARPIHPACGSLPSAFPRPSSRWEE